MGRYTNAKRAEIAAQAAEKAAANAEQAAQVETAAEAEPESRPESQERFAPRNPERDAAMEEVLARHHKGSGMEEPPPEPEVEAKPDDKPKPDAPKPSAAAPEPATAPVAAPATATAPEPAKTVRVKVDGQEFDVPESDVTDAGGIHAYQRDRASENRLKETKEALAESRRLQANIAEWVQKQAPKEPTLTEDQFITSKMDTIRFGTPEESAAALREVLQRNAPNQNAIQNQAVIQIRRTAALDKFKEEFADVNTNQLLLKLAATLESERLSKIPPNAVSDPQFAAQFDWNNFYRIIGNEVRSVVSRPSQPAAAPAIATTVGTPSQSSEKEARKASIVNLPTAAARAELPAEENLGTPDEQRRAAINEMKKSRRIPVD